MTRHLSFLLAFALGGFLFWRWGIPAFERAQIYFPTRPHEGTPRDAGLAYEDLFFETEDRVKLHGWWIPAEAPRGSVLFFHGNAGNISHRLMQAELFHRLGFSVFLVDYRGYGRSEGIPDEAGLYRDGLAAREAVTRRAGSAAERLVYYGESLGAAVAIDLATRHPPAVLVLEGGFVSVPEMARRIYPFLPVWALLRSRFDSLSKIRRVACPTFFLHARRDEIIPFEMGRRLYEASAAGRKEFLPLEGGHNDAFGGAVGKAAREMDRFFNEAGLKYNRGSHG